MNKKLVTLMWAIVLIVIIIWVIIGFMLWRLESRITSVFFSPDIRMKLIIIFLTLFPIILIVTSLVSGLRRKVVLFDGKIKPMNKKEIALFILACLILFFIGFHWFGIIGAVSFFVFIISLFVIRKIIRNI